MTAFFVPEGRLLHTQENQTAGASRHGLMTAMERGTILEGMALLCDSEHDLVVRVGEFTGLIPRREAALGIAEGTTREIAILSRVGKPICFTIDAMEGSSLLLSRRHAQEMALQSMLTQWKPGTVIPATITHLEPFGAFVDIGCGIPSMLSLEQISVSRIPHPRYRFTSGQEIFAMVTEIDPELERISLSHKALLGTWEENASLFASGMTVPGIVRGIKPYGVFVELTPNLSGLAEPYPGLLENERVSVYLKAILPDRHKIKLLIIDQLPPDPVPAPLHYFHTQGVLTHWSYTP